MEFLVNLIQLKGHQKPEGRKFLRANCTHVTKNYWIYEGDIECLDDSGVKYVLLGEGAVESLGGLTEQQLIEVVDDSFGIDLRGKTV